MLDRMWHSFHSFAFVLLATQFGAYTVAWWTYSALSDDHRSAGRYLSLFNLLLGLGLLGVSMRDDTRGWIAYVGSALCFVAAFAVAWRGLGHFVNAEQATRRQIGILLISVIGLLYAGAGAEHSALRVFVTFVGCAVLIGGAMRQIGPLLRQEFQWKWARLLRVASVAAVALFGWRAADQLMQPEQRLELVDSSTLPNAILLLGLCVAAAIFNFSYLGLVLLRYVRQLHQLTHHDPLTGLLNRRAFEEATAREWLRRKRDQKPLAVAAFDLDHFKSVNDTHGHAVGDQVLVHTAKLLRAMSREIDLVARLGGEEFVVVMPGTTEAEALAAAERLRNALATQPVKLDDGELRVTSSIGVALAEPRDNNIHDALKRADEALYKAKKSGRNRVCSSAVVQMPEFVPSVSG